jgi:hypothetical protein
MLLKVVFTDLPSKCSQSKGAGLCGLNKLGVGREPEVEGRGVGVVAGEPVGEMAGDV